MGFFDPGTERHDPLQSFKESFGGDLGGLLDFFRQRLGGQDPAVGAAFKLQRPGINRAFDTARRNVERGLVGSGGIRSAARTRRLADVGSARANALSDAISKITLQRETQLPGQLSSLLSSLASSGRDVFTSTPSTASKVGQGIGLASSALNLGGQVGTGLSGIAGMFGGAPPAAAAGAGAASDFTSSFGTELSDEELLRRFGGFL